jgi:hypothetical protein
MSSFHTAGRLALTPLAGALTSLTGGLLLLRLART